MPQSGSQLGVIYAINPTNGEAVDPKANPANPYVDDELCHEGYGGMNLAAGTTGAPCGIGAGELPTTNYYKTAAVTAGGGVHFYTRGKTQNKNTNRPPLLIGCIYKKQKTQVVVCGQMVCKTPASS